MPELLTAVLATDGLWLLAIGAVLAGLVRGFSGFGTGLVFVPFAAEVFSPIWVLIVLMTMDLLGPIPAVPRALRDGHPRDVLRLGAGALIGLPIGLWVLTSISQTSFRVVIAVVILVLLVLLVTGVRYRGVLGPRLVLGTGLLGGLMGGAVLLPGPPVILLYMARDLPVAAIRANIFLYLFLADILMVALLVLRGLLELQPILVGLVVMPAYLVSILIGTAIFDPGRGSVYRWVAYGIIAGSALRGLPIWG